MDHGPAKLNPLRKVYGTLMAEVADGSFSAHLPLGDSFSVYPFPMFDLWGKGGISRSACVNLTFQREGAVQITYAPLEVLPLESEKCAVVLPFSFD